MPYKKELVTIRELFESGVTKEPSENALRSRVRSGFLVFARSEGSVALYNKQLSIITVTAARACKKRKVTWKDVARAFKATNILESYLVEQLNEGVSIKELIKIVTERVSERIGKVPNTIKPPPKDK